MNLRYPLPVTTLTLALLAGAPLGLQAQSNSIVGGFDGEETLPPSGAERAATEAFELVAGEHRTRAVRGKLRAVRFSPDGTRLLALGRDAAAFSFPGGEEEYRVETNDTIGNRGGHAVFSPTGDLVALAGTYQGEVMVLDAATGEVQESFDTGTGHVRGLRWADRLGLVSLHWNGAVKLSRFPGSEEEEVATREIFRVRGDLWGEDDGSRLAWSGDGNSLVMSGSSRAGRVVEVPLVGEGAGEAVEVEADVGHEELVGAILPLTETKYATGDEAGVLALWERGEDAVETFRHDFGAPIRALALEPNRGLLAVGVGDDRVALVDLVTGSIEEVEVPGGDGVVALDFSPDGETLAVGARTRRLFLFDVAALSGAEAS